MDNAKVSDYIICKNICIGQGAFSKVYLGHLKNDTSKRVAIKEININQISDQLRDRFFEEMNIMNILKKNPHKNIVKCNSITHTLDKIYLIMEYCECGELSKIVKKKLTEKKTKFYFRQIVEAVIHLDKLNIIHRDIKPANILLSDNFETIKLTDFGLSRVISNSNMLNTMCGSPFYMSPEILNDQSYNKYTDIWSLGIILYELVYGSHPFKFCSNINDLKGMLKDSEITYFERNKRGAIVSVECIDLMKKLLDKDLHSRIKLSEILNHNWFDEEKEYHEFVVIDDYFPQSESIQISSLQPSFGNKQYNTTEYNYMPGSAPNTWQTRLVDSIWNIGSSTFGYISRIGTSLIKLEKTHDDMLLSEIVEKKL